MKSIKSIRIIFLVIGIGLSILATTLYKKEKAFIKTASHTQGLVMELVPHKGEKSTTYAPSIEFTTRGGELISFVSQSGSNPPQYKKGQEVQIIYQKDDPHNAKINNFSSKWLGVIIVSIIGFVFSVFGAGGFILEYRRKRKNLRLKSFGQKISAKVDQISKDSSYQFNGVNPFLIKAQYLDPASNELHIFKSERIWFNPSDFIKEGQNISIYIDPQNKKSYTMDLSFLPKVHK